MSMKYHVYKNDEFNEENNKRHIKSPQIWDTIIHYGRFILFTISDYLIYYRMDILRYRI